MKRKGRGGLVGCDSIKVKQRASIPFFVYEPG